MTRDTGKTSLNQVPAGMKKVKTWPGLLNFDYGGGKYDTATEWLWDNHKVHNVVYDIYHQSIREQNFALWMLSLCTSFTCFNVLNVMEDRKERMRVYHLIKRMPGLPQIFFSIYEGNRSGIGAETSKGWQNNQYKGFYLQEIQEVFKYGYDVMCPAGLIVLAKLEMDVQNRSHHVQRLYGGF